MHAYVHIYGEFQPRYITSRPVESHYEVEVLTARDVQQVLDLRVCGLMHDDGG